MATNCSTRATVCMSQQGSSTLRCRRRPCCSSTRHGERRCRRACRTPRGGATHFFFHAHEWGIPEAWLELVQPVAKKHAVASGYAFPEAQGDVLLEFVVACARYFGGFKYQRIEWATGVPEKEASVIARHWLPARALVLNTVFQFHNSLEVQYHTQTPGENGELLVNGRRGHRLHGLQEGGCCDDGGAAKRV
jgi:hypothetical protein